jgi:Fe-S-cluster containining protein
MVEPSKIKEAAGKYENQNMKFRTFLKNRADPDELDAHFLKLHNELFSAYDCCKCNNCCKAYDIYLEDEDVQAAAEFLSQSQEDFIGEYLTETDDGYKLTRKPCVFLREDGRCRINAQKPSACRGYPFTDHPDRIASLMGILEFSEVCPVVFEILERLKKIYHFRTR